MIDAHQILTYENYANLICDDIRMIERNFDVLLNVCMDIGLAMDIGEMKYMELGLHRGMIANHGSSNSYERIKT
jgi:hypothetical protein